MENPPKKVPQEITDFVKASATKLDAAVQQDISRVSQARLNLEKAERELGEALEQCAETSKKQIVFVEWLKSVNSEYETAKVVESSKNHA